MATTLSPDRWQAISPHLDRLLSLPEDQRASWLESFRLENPKMADLLAQLLVEHRAASQERFLERLPTQPIADPSLAGTAIGAYTLISPIGQGGMGSVWLAERSDGRFERRVAIKFLNFSVAAQGGVERFQREGRILGRLSHPHIAELIDAGITAKGEPYLVLEHVEGEHIDEYCDSLKVDLEARIRLFLDVLSAIAQAHASLIVHRDIKPSNVLVRKDGQVKLLDFGIAKLLATGDTGAPTLLTVEGGGALTPQFASPEQVTGGPITTATDVYALGVLLYLLLTGQHPAGPDSHSPADLVKAIVEVEPPRPSDILISPNAAITSQKRGTTPDKLRRQLRGDLDTVVGKALKKNPQERYGSVTAMAEDLQRSLKNEPITARPDSIIYRAAKFVRRNRTAVAVAAGLLILLAGFAVMQTVQVRRITRERDRADRVAKFMIGLFKVSDPNERVGNTVTAREVLDKAAKDIDAGLTKDPELQSRMMRVMGRAYLNLGLFSRAKVLFERSLQLGGSFVDQRDSDTLRAMHDLAWVLMQDGQLAEAEKLERKLLDIQRRVMGPDQDDTLNTMGELAYTLCQEGKCAQGVKLNREVLEKQKRTIGPDAHGTLITRDNLAMMLRDDGNIEEALVLQQDSLDRHLRVQGVENLSTINAMLNLAEIQRDAGQDDKALESLNRLLDVGQRVLGPDQGEMYAAKYDLASLLVRKGKREEALSLLEQIVDHMPQRVAVSMENDPLFAPLHGSPRFAALVTHVKQRATAEEKAN